MTPFKRKFIKVKRFFEISRYLLSLSLFLCKDFSAVKGQRVAEPTNERLPSPRQLALAGPTSGIAGWWHLKVPREGIDRRARSLARSLALSFAIGDGRERLLPSTCQRENDTGERSRRPRRENCSESLPRILGQTEETYKADGVTSSFAFPASFIIPPLAREFYANVPEHAFPPPFASLVLIVATLARLVFPRKEKEGSDGIGLGVPDNPRTCTSSVSRDIKRCSRLRLKFLIILRISNGCFYI